MSMEIQKSIQKKKLVEHGVVQFYEDRTVDYELYLKNIAKNPNYKPEFKKVPNKIHALIGTDGKYTQVGYNGISKISQS